MKKIKKLVSFLLIATFLLGGFNLAFAQNGKTVKIENPIKFDSIQEFLTELTNVLIQVGLALVAFMIVLGGGFIMFGGAKPDLVTKGKNIITWTILGVAVVVFARAILALIGYIIGG